MPASVRISLKTARALLHDFDSMPFLSAGMSAHVEALRAAMAPRKPKAFSSGPSLKAQKAGRKKTKREGRAEVRLAVMERANGSCEYCRADSLLSDLELDHMFGQARSESLETCWALCRYCHREKTNNRPDAEFWLREFITHCGTFGYSAAAERAKRRITFVSTRAALSRNSMAEGGGA